MEPYSYGWGDGFWITVRALLMVAGALLLLVLLSAAHAQADLSAGTSTMDDAGPAASEGALGDVFDRAPEYAPVDDGTVNDDRVEAP